MPSVAVPAHFRACLHALPHALLHAHPNAHPDSGSLVRHRVAPVDTTDAKDLPAAGAMHFVRGVGTLPHTSLCSLPVWMNLLRREQCESIRSGSKQWCNLGLAAAECPQARALGWTSSL
eukprot:6183950-Pleurochrysis_carterae.AAC.2